MATPKTTPNTPFSIPAFSPVESGDKAREGEGAASPASEDGGRPFKGPQFVPEAHSKVAVSGTPCLAIRMFSDIYTCHLCSTLLTYF